MLEAEILLSIADLSMELGGKLVLSGLNLELRRGERWAILGNSGSGKTALASAIAGKAYHRGRIEWHIADGRPEERPASPPAALVEQEIRLGGAGGPASGGAGYYQQRYNAADAEEGPSLREVLALSTGGLAAGGLAADGLAAVLPWARLLQLTPLLERPALQLSSGERRRAQIARALAGGPSLLILDDPFTALDAQGRETLLEALGRLGRGRATFLLFQSRGEIPDFITHVAELREGRLSRPVPRTAYIPRAEPAPAADARAGDRRIPQALLTRDAPPSFETAVRLVDAVVRYGDILALDRVSWEVGRGERWSLTGPNGAGKTSLLSLITADHPQAYANELYLFDRRRGSGETIWDIKERIGFVSPELHAAFPRNATREEVVASGLFDSIGLYRRLDAEEERRVSWWLEAVGEGEGRSRARALSDLPLGEQRMLLLARALVKRPPLLILDEPCQGLDAGQTELFLELLDSVCAASDATMIYVSHVETEIPDCVTKSLRLEAGRVVYRGERGL